MLAEINTKKYIQYSSYLQKLISYLTEDNSDYVNENLMYEVLYAIHICEKYDFESILSLLEAYKVTKKGTLSGGKLYGDLLKLRNADYTFGKNTKYNRTSTCIKAIVIMLFCFIGVIVLSYIVGTGDYRDFMQILIGFMTLVCIFMYGAYTLSLVFSLDNNTEIKSSEVHRDLRAKTMDSEMHKCGIKDYNVFSSGTLAYVDALVKVELEYEEYILEVKK